MMQSRRAAILIGTGAVLGTVALLFYLGSVRPTGRVLELQVRTTAGEFARLSWEAASGTRGEQQPLTRTPDGFQSLRFTLPSETLQSVRLVPMDRPGELMVEHLRVVEADGTLVRELNPRSLLPESQIASVNREGRLVRIVTDPDATAPSLKLTPACLDERSAWYSLSSVTPLSLALATSAFLVLIVAAIAILAAETPMRAAGATVTRWSPVMWLAVLFLLVVSAKLLLLHVYPARVPYLDQWDAEAAGVYIPFDEGCLSWRQMVSFHNEHRIFLTRLLALGLLMANGQWDPQLQQIVNAGLHAMTALAVAFGFWRASDGRRLNLVVVFCAVLFTLPFGWENTLAGFQSSFYLLILLSVLSLTLTVKRVRSGAWVLGWLCAVSTLVTTAGGLFTPVATGIAAVLRLVTGRCTRREAVVNLGMSGAVFAFGLSLVSPAIRQSGVYVPQSVGEFTTALASNLAWPWVDVHWMSIVAWVPLLALVAVMVRRRSATDQEVLMASLGAWVAIQAAGLAFARGAGGVAPASRYMDILSLGVVANAMALIALADRLHAYRRAWRLATAVLMAWSACAIVGSARIGDVGLQGAAERRAWMTTYEQTLRSFLKDDNIAAFASKGFPEMVPHWSASMLGNAWLRHPYMREILPPAVREPLSLDPRPGAPPVFVDNGVYPTTPTDVARRARGSYTSVGNPTQGQFESLPVRCQSGAYLRFEIAGYLGAPGLSLSVRRTPGVEVPVPPGEVARERWIASLVRCPADPFTIVAADSRPDLWFAFADPIEVPWGSHIAQSLIDRAWGCLWAALGLMLLAALFDPAPLTG